MPQVLHAGIRDPGVAELELLEPAQANQPREAGIRRPDVPQGERSQTGDPADPLEAGFVEVPPEVAVIVLIYPFTIHIATALLFLNWPVGF